jgi:MoaA/NifB/PqqE/SkfB family radical SAM enzyme
MHLVNLPETVCFRVTRFCNASCGFCLAPPDGQHPSTEVLANRLTWLATNGVRVVHFCGGEPTIHPGIAQLIECVYVNEGKTRLTTNGIVLTEELLSVLSRYRTHVKVSLHGDREFHNRMVGRNAFDKTTQNIRRLTGAGIHTSIQTTLVSGGESVVDWVVKFCRDEGVSHLNFLPFIPRGSGFVRRAEFELASDARRFLYELVRNRRKRLGGYLDIKWLDFNSGVVPVVEADGTLVLEGRTETSDRIIGTVPSTCLQEPTHIANVHKMLGEKLRNLTDKLIDIAP